MLVIRNCNVAFMNYGNIKFIVFIHRGAGPSRHGKFHGPRDRYKEREVSLQIYLTTNDAA